MDSCDYRDKNSFTHQLLPPETRVRSMWEGFGSRGAAGAASGRGARGLPHGRAEPAPGDLPHAELGHE